MTTLDIVMQLDSRKNLPGAQELQEYQVDQEGPKVKILIFGIIYFFNVLYIYIYHSQKENVNESIVGQETCQILNMAHYISIQYGLMGYVICVCNMNICTFSPTKCACAIDYTNSCFIMY